MGVRQEIVSALEDQVETLGFEVVDVRWGGSGRRPLLRLRIDRPGSEPGHGVTVDDCATVSRALEPWLDEYEGLSERYVLEVSSPGVERPLVRDRDYARFRGQRIAVTSTEVLAGRATRLEGELLGLEEGDEETAVALKLDDGEEVRIPRDGLRKVHLVFSWT